MLKTLRIKDKIDSWICAGKNSDSLKFRSGVFHALLNAKNWLEYHKIALRRSRMTAEDTRKILEVFIENLDEFMALGDSFEISSKKIPKKGRIFYKTKK